MVKCPFKLNFDDLKDRGPTGFLETGLVGLDIKGISVCGMLDYNDPGETSLNNLAECAGKLYAVAAYNIASEREL